MDGPIDPEIGLEDETDDHGMTLDFRIEEAKDILDRIINFIRLADDKANITMAVIGVIITATAMAGGNGIVNVVNSFKSSIDAFPLIVLSILIFSGMLLAYGFFYLLKTVYPDTTDKAGIEDEKMVSESVIYFKHVASIKSYSDYELKFSRYSKDQYYNDILAQAYINARICTEKADMLQKGFKASVVGVAVLLIAIGLSFIA